MKSEIAGWKSSFKTLRSWHPVISLHGKEKGKNWKQWEIFLSWTPEDGDCSHEIKSHLLLGRKTRTSLDSILKSRDITLLTEVHIIKAMVSPVNSKGINQLILKESILNIHWKDWCWSSYTLVTWCEELTHWKKFWFWDLLKAKGEGAADN